MPFYDTSGERDADRYLRMKENMEDDFQSPHLFPEAHADNHPLAEVVIVFPGQTPMTCVVTTTEQPIVGYGTNKMQITTKSPIGAHIAKHISNLTVGMELPNGGKILEIISQK